MIKGDKATKGTLVINRGGKIMAEGTAEKPIVFTSKLGAGERSRGDWGGIILLGKAPINQATANIEGLSQPFPYGGTDEHDNSGVMKYVRIEYAGIALSPGNETNGLTFGGVGDGTTIDYIQSSYGGDDAFEWFGGSVNCKHLISLGAWDDDIDTDFGFHGNIQFAAAFRERGLADESQSNGFECDNDGTGTNATPKNLGHHLEREPVWPSYRFQHHIQQLWPCHAPAPQLCRDHREQLHLRLAAPHLH